MIVEPYDFSSPFNSRKRHFIPSALSNENQIEVRQLNDQRQVTDNKESDTNKSVRYFNNDEISGRTGAGSSCKAAAEQRIETVETSGPLSYSRGECFLLMFSDRIFDSSVERASPNLAASQGFFNYFFFCSCQHLRKVQLTSQSRITRLLR